MSDAVFLQRDGDRFVATELARGPWDVNAQHGGAPAALITYVFESLAGDDGLVTGRITYEFLRPVPLGELSVRAQVARPGRRVQLLEGSIFASDDVEVVRARALRVRRAQDVPEALLAVDSAPPGPEQGRPNDFEPDGTMFAPSAMELRFVAGTFRDPGPATAWFRLRMPMIEGIEPSPLQRLTAAADFGNGISAVVSWDEYLFINPDLTVYVEREPVGEWICLESSTRIAPDGIGSSESVLYDRQGRVGRATQALVVSRR